MFLHDRFGQDGIGDDIFTNNRMSFFFPFTKYIYTRKMYLILYKIYVLLMIHSFRFLKKSIRGGIKLSSIVICIIDFPNVREWMKEKKELE